MHDIELMFGALIRAAERGKSIKVTEFGRPLSAVKKEPDRESKASLQRAQPKPKIFGSSRTCPNPLQVPGDMTELLVLSHPDNLTTVAQAWDRLRKDLPYFFPDFESAALLLSDAKRDFRVLAIKNGDQITCLACFVFGPAMKPFKLGERKLFSVPVHEVRLFGSAILGDLDDTIFGQFIDVIRTTFNFDLISFGHVLLNSTLHGAINKRRAGFFATSPSRKTSIRWLINLPRTFDEYLARLSSNQRQGVKRKMRKLEQELKWEFRIIHRPEQVEGFLRDSEAISRLTYQWNVGDRLCNDEATRLLYIRRAMSGHLHCYIMYAQGKPCAFLRGELIDDIYYYETPGYDPQYSKLSPGLVLLMWAIRDLIEQTSCKVFDFGLGGDAFGYKSKFGNIGLECDDIELGRWSRPYAVAIMVVQEGLNAAKSSGNWLLGQSKVRQRFKRAIRKYGDRW